VCHVGRWTGSVPIRLDVQILADDGSTLGVTTAPPDRDNQRSLVAKWPKTAAKSKRRCWWPSSRWTGGLVYDTLELAGWSVEIGAPRTLQGRPYARTTASTCGSSRRCRAGTSSRSYGCLTHRYIGRAFGLMWSNATAPWRADTRRRFGSSTRRRDRDGSGRVRGQRPRPSLRAAAEIGDIWRFHRPTKLVGYSGLCSRVYQSGETQPQEKRAVFPTLGAHGGGHARGAPFRLR